jgi:DNA-binding beta-propeller fold protein YncE
MGPIQRAAWLVVALFSAAVAATPRAQDIQFESPPVHPIELSTDGSRLFAVHTADHRLVVFDVSGAQPVKTHDIMVGIEPVSVRARTSDEVWVVNHISDDINVVNLATGNIERTILVGDEPTDVVFANGRAFVCVSQEDRVRAYDLADLAAPPVDIPLETSDPRSLAVSGDGATVYVTALEGGNRTTAIPFLTVDALGGPPAPDPPMNPSLPPPPRVSLIVRHDGTGWRDETGAAWDEAVPYTMPDNDVLAINTTSLAVTAAFHDVGTSMFNVAVHPVDGSLHVTNQEAFNEIRFEPKLNARFIQNRVTIIEPSGGVITPRHLNDHIDYTDPAGSAGERALSLCMPLDVTVSSAGEVYVAAFGSRKVGVLDAAGNVTRRITVGEGPAGLALDEIDNRLFVWNRFSSSLSVVDLSDDTALEYPLGFDPSPAHVRDGRKFLYDGEISSAHGDLACASCHIFGDMDNLAWDLGDPGASAMIPVPPAGDPTGTLPDFHPMKGPMTTQSLKALADTEPLHWRGDRALFSDFNIAFPNLMGRGSTLPAGDMQLFQDFVFSMRYPPNPFRELDGSLPPTLNGADPINGEQLYLTGNLVGGLQCVSCHALPTGENGLVIPGNALQEDEAKVVPQLRNLYEKTRFDNTAASTVRGFGFIHDGAVDDLFSFLQFSGFTFANDNDRRDVAAFLLAFDSGTHAGVGAQWTTDGSSDPAGMTRLNTLQTLADAGVIGLVAKGIVTGQPRGWVYAGGGMWTPDKEGESDLGQSALLALAASGAEMTFTGVVAGWEWRLGVDQDVDTYRDGDERDAGSDPTDPESTPEDPPTAVYGDTPSHPVRLWLAGSNPAGDQTAFGFALPAPGPVRMEVYDVRGRLVRRLLNQSRHPAGDFRRAWDLANDAGQRVSSGVYFVRMQAVGTVRVRRVAVVR